MLDERKFFVKKVCQSDTSPLEKVCQPPKKCVRNGHLREKKTLKLGGQAAGVDKRDLFEMRDIMTCQ